MQYDRASVNANKSRGELAMFFVLFQMVTDLIKIPCVRNFVFRDHLQSYPESIVNVTLHNVIITHKETDGNYKELWVSDAR